MGEGFAFAAWVRSNAMAGDWYPEAHGWHCQYCREAWTYLQRRSGEQL